jgi:hypothetical protein
MLTGSAISGDSCNNDGRISLFDPAGVRREIVVAVVAAAPADDEPVLRYCGICTWEVGSVVRGLSGGNVAGAAIEGPGCGGEKSPRTDVELSSFLIVVDIAGRDCCCSPGCDDKGGGTAEATTGGNCCCC